MDPSEANERLSRIKTHWSLVFQAHQGLREAGPGAQQELLLRYYGAVYRYLRGMLRDSAVAEELTQDFAVRFLRGDFKHADPQRGRFRDFLKTAVRHLVIDHWRRQEREKEAAGPLPADSAVGPAAPVDDADSDAEFLTSWREELLLRAWEALAQFQQESGSPYYTVLRTKTEQPQLHSAELAEQLGAQLGKPFTEVSVRQTLHRARDKFATLLLEEVARSLPAPTPQELEQELIELGLLDYCKTALQRR
jgi:RNA polymerase sigma-70 factor (ECF subfamily)